MHVQRGLQNELTAGHYAIQNGNIDLLKLLLEDLKAPKKNRCPFPTVTMNKQSTGQSVPPFRYFQSIRTCSRANIRTFGFRTAQITAARGVKEGNNALNKVELDQSLIVGSRSVRIARTQRPPKELNRATSSSTRSKTTARVQSTIYFWKHFLIKYVRMSSAVFLRAFGCSL